MQIPVDYDSGTTILFEDFSCSLMYEWDRDSLPDFFSAKSTEMAERDHEMICRKLMIHPARDEAASVR
ncbi:MAG: hypothetical protein ABJZ54_03440 [Luteolibacter sp.]